MIKKKWLAQFPNEITIGHRNRLSAYLIALEGWRRGLTLTWYSKKVKSNRVHAPGRLFSLESNERIHYFYKSKGDLTSNQAQKITGNKATTKKWLFEAGVPVPEGNSFVKKDSNQEIIEYANKLGYPLVLKPRNGYQGIGVFANILDESSFIRALQIVRDEMGYQNVIVERHIEGIEYRVFVIGDKVIGAIEKIPPNVIGDGESTIKELIKKKNKDKRDNPHLFRKPIKIDYEVKKCIEEYNYTLDTILEKNEQIFLRKMNSLSSGGDPVDATDKISKETKETAIKALQTIPNLANAGIDVMVDKNTGKTYVIEINAIAMIGSHLYPEYGKARDVPGAIIDYYFPETVGKKHYNEMVYFDLNQVLRPLHSKVASKVVVTTAPEEFESIKKYKVIGKVQGVNYRRWIRRQALERDLYGTARNNRDGSVTVIVAGNEEQVINFKQVCLSGPSRAKVEKVETKDWNKPIRAGFFIQGPSRKSKKKKSVKNKRLKSKPSIFQRIKHIARRFIRG